MTSSPVRSVRRAGLRFQRRRLAGSTSRFIRWHDALDEGRLGPPNALDGEPEVVRVVEGLKRDGIARWPGMFDEAWIEAARREVGEVLDRAVALEPEIEPGGSIKDEITNATLPRGLDPSFARTRAMFDHRDAERSPGTIAGLFEEPRLRHAVRGYYGTDRAWCSTVLAERLGVGRSADAWHFDKLFDQVKVMILLEDCTEDQGPLRYKVGTHARPEALDHFFHQSFRGGPFDGLDWNYPPLPMVYKIPGEVVLGTGRAGDAIFFDTLGVHSGSLCLSGNRLALVTYFNVATPKNDALYRLFFPDRAV